MSNDVQLSEVTKAAIALLVEVTDSEIASYRKHGTEELKGSNDLVTDADRRIERQLSTGLTALITGSRARGEEGTGVANDGGDEFQWVLDPIDGTVNFARGCEFYTSVIALLYKGVPQIAIAYQHDSQVVTFAIRSKGCYRVACSDLPAMEAATRLHVYPRPLEQTLYSLMISPKISPSARRASFQFAENTLNMALGFRVLISQAYEATKLAAGGINAVISFHSSGGWTRDAARLFCEEAGGAYAPIVNTAPTGERGFVLSDSTELVESLRSTLLAVGYKVGDISTTSPRED